MEPLGRKIPGDVQFSKKVGHVRGEIKKVSDIIDNIINGKENTVNKFKSLNEIKSRIIESSDTKEEIKSLKEELEGLLYTVWGRGRRKYLDAQSKKDPSQLNGEQTILNLEKMIESKENRMMKMAQQIGDFNIPNALEKVQASLDQLNKITLSTSDLKVEVSLTNLIESSNVFNRLLKRKKSNEMVFTFDKNFKQEDIKTFFAYFESKNVQLTGENAIPLFLLAEQYAVEPLLQECFNFITENASWESFPEILDLGIKTKHKELIWNACNVAMNEPEFLIKMDFQGLEVSNETMDILNDLKKLAELKEPRILCPSLGKVEVSKYSDQLSSLNNLNQLIPISLEIKNLQEVFNDFKSLSENCPFIDNLVIYSVESTQPAFLKEALNGFKRLNGFGTPQKEFISIEEIEEYQKELFPIELSALNLSKYPDLKDSDLEKIFKNLKKVKILDLKNQKITKLPYENLDKIICEKCTSLEMIEASNASYVSCQQSKVTHLIAPKAISVNSMNCTTITNLYAPNAKYVNCTGCESLLTLDATSAIRLYCTLSKVVNLIALKAENVHCYSNKALTNLNVPNATYINCAECESLSNLDAPNATEIYCQDSPALKIINAPNAKRIDCSGCSPDLVLNVPEDCIIIREW